MTAAQPSPSTRSPRLSPNSAFALRPLRLSVILRPRICHSSLNSRPFNLLRTLCRRQKDQLLCNQANPDSFAKTPGVGVPQHIHATLRFRRRMRHVAPLSPVPSFDCAYFPSPRGCTPYALPISRRLWQTQLARPLFSYSYELLFPQLPCFHNHPHCPGLLSTNCS